jgi:hypothetical protein
MTASQAGAIIALLWGILLVALMTFGVVGYYVVWRIVTANVEHEAELARIAERSAPPRLTGGRRHG